MPHRLRDSERPVGPPTGLRWGSQRKDQEKAEAERAHQPSIPRLDPACQGENNLPLQPFSIDSFRGLDLQTDPLELGATGAVDLLNVDLDRLGRVRTRAGSTKLNSSAFTGTGTVERVFEWPETRVPLRYSLSGNTVTVDALADDGTDSVFTTWTGAGVGGAYMAHAFIGTATTKYLFISQAIPAASPLVRRIDSGGTNAASVGSCYYIAAWQERLVQANVKAAPAGAVTGDSVVFFSGAGTPETFSANDYVQVGLNDGEPITGMVTWREFLFVFKQTRMFVFYGISIDADGLPIFNYRAVDLPSRLDASVDVGEIPMVAGPDAVYMALADGIYASAGGVPVEVSQLVRPLFEKTAAASIRRDSRVSLDFAGGRIFARYTNDSASATRTLVYNTALKSWTIWGLAAVVNLLEHFQNDGGHVVYWADQSNIYKLDDAVTTDNGTTISWQYTSGMYDMDAPGQV